MFILEDYIESRLDELEANDRQQEKEHREAEYAEKSHPDHRQWLKDIKRTYFPMKADRLDRDEVLASADMESFILRYCLPPYRKHGDKMTVRCPMHGEDKRPSMSVNLLKKRYTCYSCGESDTLVGLVQRMENVNFIEALTIIKNG